MAKKIKKTENEDEIKKQLAELKAELKQTKKPKSKKVGKTKPKKAEKIEHMKIGKIPQNDQIVENRRIVIKVANILKLTKYMHFNEFNIILTKLISLSTYQIHVYY